MQTQRATVRSNPKLTSEERHASLLKALRRIFAEKGFDGVSTRELAQSAGVSEALLFKHFPNKEAMFTAIQEACCSEQDLALYERLHALEPSASTLVLLVHFLVSRVVRGPADGDDEWVIPLRLMLRSLSEDGAFARLWLRRLATEWVPKIEECVQAAVHAGEAVASPVQASLAGWFTHHLAAMVMLHLLPDVPVVDYGVSRETLVAQIVFFTLRGIGLKDAAVRRHYNPKALALFDARALMVGKDSLNRDYFMKQHLLLPIAGFALTLAGCAQETPQEASLPPPSVTVAPLVKRGVTDYADFTGRAAAVESVKVRARVWGHLKNIKFTEGAEVKKDDVLFIIDRRPYQAALDRADADVGQGEARVKRLDADFARMRNLLMSKAISREDFDKVAGDLSEARATLGSLQAARAVAKLNLDYTEVRAPIDGRISRAMVTVGNLVESGELGGTLLTTLVSLDPVYVYFDVDDLTYLRVGPLVREKKAPPVLLGLPAESGYSLKGTIDFVDNQVDPGTATMKMRGVFKNADRRLTPGLFVRVRVPLGAEHAALLISDRAIDTDQGQKVVYVVNKDNVVEKRAVKLGRLHDGLREIVEGATAGERLVVDGLQRVRDGITVTPKDEGGKDKRPK